MILNRPLAKKEFNRIIQEADSNETWGLTRIDRPFTYLNSNCVESSGIIINGRPIYFAYLLNENGKYILWTVVNQNVEHQFSLYKISKRIVTKWLHKYKEIYATMRTNNPKNIEWTQALGFKIVKQDSNFITFKLEEK